MLHIPLLRNGDPYKSLDVACLSHHQTQGPFVEVSQANSGLIRRDLLDQASARDALVQLSTRELLDICARASEHFVNDVLSFGDDEQTPDDYVLQVSATTGLPHVMVRRNMQKIRNVLAEMGNVLDGLTRNLDLKILDDGLGYADGHALSFFPRATSLGVVLPNNSPGVHSLWIPAVPLKMPLVLKPGSVEPWTPYRIVQALSKAGCPNKAFSIYPTDHAGAGEILQHCGRGMIFGDVASTEMWQDDNHIEIHGPGYSKIVIGEDCIDDWEKYLDVMIESIAGNGGRSCVNASGIWVTAHANDIADALSERLSKIIPLDAADDQAEIAPFADANVAGRINKIIEGGLAEPGARDVTAGHRNCERLVTWQNCSYLLPTIIHCDDALHTLANREFLFPYATVVQVPAAEMVGIIGPSLVVTAITSDPSLIKRLVFSRNVDRLNLGAVPTTQVSWDQPHEGNLFEHLYARRAFQRTSAAV